MTGNDSRKPTPRPEAHTELRRQGEDEHPGNAPTLQPRAKRLPDELRDDPSDDDVFNDVPV